MTSSTKKYKLFSATALADPSLKPICAFFGTSQGCRLGDQCQFRHEAAGAESQPQQQQRQQLPAPPQPRLVSSIHNQSNGNINTAPVSDSSSVMSSESEGEIQEPRVQNPFATPSYASLADNPIQQNRIIVAPNGIKREAQMPQQLQQQQQPMQQLQQQQPKQEFAQPQQPTNTEATNTESTSSKKRKRKKAAAAGNTIFANPKKQPDMLPAYVPLPAIAAAPVSAARVFANQAAAPAITNHDTMTANNNGAKKKPRSAYQDRVPIPATAKAGDFRSLQLPLTPFSTGYYDADGSKAQPSNNTNNNTPKSNNNNNKINNNNNNNNTTSESTTAGNVAVPEAETPTAVVKKQLPEPLPTSTEVGRQWQEMVIQTRRHANFERCFDFARYQELEEQTGLGGRFAWIQAKQYGTWCAKENHPAVIALDCEMCETQDPVSGARDSKALCRVSIVNGENPSEVLLDTLVKPSWPIIDYRTRFHGITPEDLEPVQCTLRHVQAFLMALCSEETVLVGHAIHNDLMAMKMEHYCVADSSFLFPVQDSTTASASLKLLATSFLKQDMPTVHDSVLDARTALLCVEYFRDHQDSIKPVERLNFSKGVAGGGGEFAKQLLVHRIPKPCLPEHLEQMFVHHTRVQPLQVPDIEYSGDTGKAIVSFLSAQHCNLAFETLQGSADIDNSGRAQKKVYLRTGSYVRIRKMAFERKSSGSASSKKNPFLPATPGSESS